VLTPAVQQHKAAAAVGGKQQQTTTETLRSITAPQYAQLAVSFTHSRSKHSTLS
jgi:hypothetical protein